MERKHLSNERPSLTHRFKVGDVKGYVIVGLFEDGSPGEVFLRVSRQGSSLRGAMDSFAIMVSLALQYGIPLEDMVKKFRGTSFEPDGNTTNAEIPFAKSVVDYIFRWLEMRFVKKVESDLDVDATGTADDNLSSGFVEEAYEWVRQPSPPPMNWEE